MKKLIFGLTACILATISCKNEQKPELPPINKLLDSYYEASLKLNPLSATFAGDNRYNDLLSNNLTQSFKDKALAVFNNFKDSLNLYPDDKLTDEEKTSKAILLWELDQNIHSFDFKNELMPINQFSSLQLMMGQLGSGSGAQPFKTVQDYRNWLKRLDSFTVWIDTAQANMKKGVGQGYVLPKTLIVKMIPQLTDFSKTPVEENLFYSPVKNFPESFTEAEKAELTKEFSALLSEKFIPVFAALTEYVKTGYLAAGRESSGIEGIPNGKELYNYWIKYYTTTDLTAEEIHQLGLSEVARISGEMEKVMAEVGYKGSLISFFDYVRNKKELIPFAQAEQVIANFNAIHERMKPNLEKLFDLKPKTQFEVRRTESFREASASAEYNQGSLDGTRPGIFYVPIPDVKTYNYYADEDLFLHEAIPGHHYQVSIQQENQKLPQFRRTLWYSAYGEGWALYAESLGKELGLYENPYQYFGMLSAEMHRAIRLVVDTGLHAKGWTRDQAIQYSLEHEAESEESIIAEIERYMVIPGQALSYKIGQLKIRELRAKAEKTLGKQFDIRKFHNQVLMSGSLPLNLLETKIDNWIADGGK
ncbi:MAG: DUF885 domain-containing protein [Flavobacteriales bacterium CG_4_9_14_3_um_filter_40_17]|nr:MAG: DUF885 domain-containing protein [Flavobacteriales bacterium CG_4_9_14_3_um_filter_40_17]